jgi:hypothetical protein
MSLLDITCRESIVGNKNERALQQALCEEFVNNHYPY